MSRIARESTERGGAKVREKMWDEEGEMRWGVKKVETEIGGGVQAEQGEEKGRGGEEKTVNNGTSVKMPEKLEG